MGPDDLTRRYAALRATRDSGALEDDGFVAACAELRAQDANGQWWAVDTDGRLLRYDARGGVWVPVPAAVASAAPTSGRRHKRGKRVAGAHSPERAARGKADAAPSAGTTAPAPPPVAAGGATTAVLGVILSFVGGYAVSVLGWDLFRSLPMQINNMMPVGGCTAYMAGTIEMFLCSAMVGLRVMFGSLVLAVLLIMLRKPIGGIAGLLSRLFPPSLRAVLPSIIASGFFAVVWAGSHYGTGHLMGLMTHQSFPALVGALSFVTIQYGPSIMSRAPGLFAARDRLSGFMRWLLVLAVPLVVTLVITMEERVSNEAMKQQIVVIVGMLAAFFLLTPRPAGAPAAQGRS